MGGSGEDVRGGCGGWLWELVVGGGYGKEEGVWRGGVCGVVVGGGVFVGVVVEGGCLWGWLWGRGGVFVGGECVCGGGRCLWEDRY